MKESGVEKLSFIESIRSSFSEIMYQYDDAYIMGQGINDTIGMFGGTTGLADDYGYDRVFDTPLAETSMTGIAIGTALAGMHPIYCHNRPDFLYLAMDQLVNHASKYRYMSGGKCSVPMIIWAVTGEGWGAAGQHSQSLHGLFMHIPGMKIIMPTTPYDVKGLLMEAITDNNPVLFLDHRKLHSIEGEVPTDIYRIPFGKGVVRREGKDVTIVAISTTIVHAIEAAIELDMEGISCEIIDLRTIKPYDKEIIMESVNKTGRLLVVDSAWSTAGVASEISCEMQEKLWGCLKSPIKRLGWPDVPAPASYALEQLFFVNKEKIIKAVRELVIK